MRLIRTAPPIKLGEFGDKEVANLKYAILSHRWQEEEVTLQEMMNPTIQTRDKKGYQKIARFCERACADGFEYAWVDTCCINKESSVELSEAINSMFRWYRDSACCYAYMSDVASRDDLASSLWFTRGWTLQELIAPRKMVFLNHIWQSIGSRVDLCKRIHQITKIAMALLLGISRLHSYSIADRMSWASARQTTRTEDQAYCLMGIFDVNMPLLYGEGTKAFIRLQEEIMRESNDESLFAWEREDYESEDESEESSTHTLYGLLAHSPRDFADSAGIFPASIFGDTKPFASTNRGIGIQAPIFPIHGRMPYLILQCSMKERPIGFQVAPIGRKDDKNYTFVRSRGKLAREIPVNLLRGAVLDTVYILKTLPKDFQDSDFIDDSESCSIASSYILRYNLDSELKVQPRGHHKTLVILFDDIKSHSVGRMMESSVATIHRTLRRNLHDQVCFYRPWTRKTTLKEIIMHGYEFLVKHIMTNDDTIVFFGYSKGAYAAKILLNMIHSMGILLPENIHLMHEVWRLFNHDDHDVSSVELTSEQRIACEMKRAFRDSFARHPIEIRFCGFFDAVDPYFLKDGILPVTSKRRYSLPKTNMIVRHAISIDERQLLLRPDNMELEETTAIDAQFEYLTCATGNDRCSRDIQQVWFPGTHQDIGGEVWSATQSRYNLKNLPLVWMIRQAKIAGLSFDGQKEALVTGGKRLFEYKSFGGIAFGTADDEDDDEESCDSGIRELGDWERLIEWEDSEDDGDDGDDATSRSIADVPKTPRFKLMNLLRKHSKRGLLHDELRFGTGWSTSHVVTKKAKNLIFSAVLGCYYFGKFPGNKTYRSIPPGALIHCSALYRMNGDPTYRPPNLRIGDTSKMAKYNIYEDNDNSPFTEYIVQGAENSNEMSDNDSASQTHSSESSPALGISPSDNLSDNLAR